MSPEQEKKLNDLSDSVKEIHAALLGNDYHEGISPRLKKVEEYQQNDKHLKAKIAGGVTVFSIIGGGIVSFITWLFKH